MLSNTAVWTLVGIPILLATQLTMVEGSFQDPTDMNRNKRSTLNGNAASRDIGWILAGLLGADPISYTLVQTL